MWADSNGAAEFLQALRGRDRKAPPFFYSDVEIDSEMQLSVKIMDNIKNVKADLIAEIEKRVSDRILEQTNADLLIKLINNADSLDEAINIAALGTTYKRTGLHFDKRLEKMSNTIKYFKKNETLSFHTDDDKPTHKLIIGDNYEALQNLLIQYRGKVNVIYIDPPYGKDSMGEFAATNYNNAITRDNLLSMLYPRLQLAKQLLSDDGVIFCSIDDKNQAYVKCLMDEVMGEGNFISSIPRLTKTQRAAQENHLDVSHDYILCFSRLEQFSHIEEKKIDKAKLKEDNIGRYIEGDTKAILADKSKGYSAGGDYDFEYNGKTFKPVDKNGIRNRWLWTKQRMKAAAELGILVETGNSLRMQLYLDYKFDEKTNTMIHKNPTIACKSSDFMLDKYDTNSAGSAELKSIGLDLFQSFANPKPSKLIVDLIRLCENADTILDFFAGSGTTGHAVLDLNKQDGGNRTFILCQLNEKTETTPNGIAYDVTSKRLKRIMTGECYDGSKDFKWLEKNEPYGGNLDVYEIDSVSNFEWAEGKTPFDVVDETLYGKEKFATVREKIEWVCGNFDKTQKYLEKLNEEE